ncbi:MAG: hypothetical protein IJR87_10080, partial [Bacteroidaceae bacterium]|nr:hypothetical protein [Bacteroidaceae bacterium]
AWTIPSQRRTLLLFANYSTKDVSLRLDCPLSEWGYEEGHYDVTRYDIEGVGKALEALPGEMVFHSNEAFVLEITPRNSSVIEKVQKRRRNQNTYYDLSGRRLEKNRKGVNIINGKTVLVK